MTSKVWKGRLRGRAGTPSDPSYPRYAIRRTNRATYWPERVEFMKKYGNMLDGFKEKAKGIHPLLFQSDPL